MPVEDFLVNLNEGFKDRDIFVVAEKIESNTQMNEVVRELFDEEMKRIFSKMGREEGKEGLEAFTKMLEDNKDKLKSPFARLTLKHATIFTSAYEEEGIGT